MDGAALKRGGFDPFALADAQSLIETRRFELYEPDQDGNVQLTVGAYRSFNIMLYRWEYHYDDVLPLSFIWYDLVERAPNFDYELGHAMLVMLENLMLPQTFSEALRNARSGNFSQAERINALSERVQSWMADRRQAIDTRAPATVPPGVLVRYPSLFIEDRTSRPWRFGYLDEYEFGCLDRRTEKSVWYWQEHHSLMTTIHQAERLLKLAERRKPSEHLTQLVRAAQQALSTAQRTVKDAGWDDLVDKPDYSRGWHVG